LRNQYAYLDEDAFGGYSALPNQNEYTEATSSEITKDRVALQNPYAHENESGGFSALSDNSHLQAEVLTDVSLGTHFLREINTQKDRCSKIEIERRAIRLQKSIWKYRKQIWPDNTPTNPIDMLDPLVALRLIGYNSDLDETLGQFYSGGKLIEVAGTIDKYLKQIHISRKFPEHTRRYTAAHELGHALLHETSGLHRDRPLDGTTISRNAVEFEADKFAAFFLMPEKLVKTNFKRFFLMEKFTLSETTAHALGMGTYESLMKKFNSLRQLSRALASAEHYNGLQFISLAKQFHVTNEAMAIRLEELELLGI
jgi:Zn-dependent peptidase ImmA (M78 family)